VIISFGGGCRRIRRASISAVCAYCAAWRACAVWRGRRIFLCYHNSCRSVYRAARHSAATFHAVGKWRHGGRQLGPPYRGVKRFTSLRPLLLYVP
jgi:hypothetical protein